MITLYLSSFTKKVTSLNSAHYITCFRNGGKFQKTSLDSLNDGNSIQ